MNVHRIDTTELTRDSVAIVYHGKVYHAMNFLDCFDEALSDNGNTFQTEYGLDPIAKKYACMKHIEENILPIAGNDILGVDILKSSRTRYFVVQYKTDWHKNLNRLAEYCTQHDFALAFYSQDKPGMIVPVH